MSGHSHYPPPHRPQAHFYGAPELDFGIAKPSKKQHDSGDSAYSAFDGLPSSNYDSRRGPGDVLLVGSDHALDVYDVDRKRFDRIGHLAGLRGTVLRAAVLPDLTSDSQSINVGLPLVAMVIHGPCLRSRTGARDVSADLENEEFEPTDSMIQENQQTEPYAFETTVEVCSLKTGAHVQTLFQSPRIEGDPRSHRHASYIPLSAVDLSLKVHGKYVIVSSGKSGEVFMFEHSHGSEEAHTSPFKCIGKIWTKTTTKTPRNSSMSSSESDPSSHQESLHPDLRQPQVPILSLSSRWLAFVPPASSAQTTLHGTVLNGHSAGKVHGVSSHASPGEPQVTCQLDTPDAESFFNKVARDGAQTLMKSAQWVGSQGLQAWNSYWAKPHEQTQQRYSTSLPQSSSTGPVPNNQVFPPTHAQDSRTNPGRNQAALVSILDLDKLSKSQHLKTTVALEPIATFALPTGCSLVSFAPCGLKLMTASSKGDVQQVWDLMRMLHGNTGRYRGANAPAKGTTVREVARFTRVTEAKIIDVAWLEPRGIRLAVVTSKGTVHIYDMPREAFQWPPPRRALGVSTAPAEPKEPSKQQNAPPQQPQTAFGTLNSAFGMLSSTTQPILAAVRGRSPSAGSPFSTLGGFTSTAGIGAKGGKAVAAGVNRSVSAAAVGTYNTIRHLGENRVALPMSSTIVAPGCVRWMTGRDRGALAVTGGGVVKIYGIRQSSNPKAGKRRPSVLGDKPTEHSVPQHHPTFNEGFNGMTPTIRDGQTQTHEGSFWSQQHSSRPPQSHVNRTSAMSTHPLSFAEIDTTAAYQPFHTDRRVTFSAYDEDATTGFAAGLQSQPQPSVRKKSKHGQKKPATWLFGQAIPSTMITTGSSSHDDDEPDDAKNPAEIHGTDMLSMGMDDDTGVPMSPASDMENVIRIAETNATVGDGNEHGDARQEIVVTTTRRKKKMRNRQTVSGPGNVDSEQQLQGGELPGVSSDDRTAREEEEREIFEDDCEVVDFAEDRV